MNKIRVVQLAVAISRYLQDLSWQHKDNDPIPSHEFAYAQAINKWEDDGKPNDSFFSIKDNADPMMLRYRKELSMRFGLPVLTQAEAEDRKRQKPTITEKVCEQAWIDIPGIEPFKLSS